MAEEKLKNDRFDLAKDLSVMIDFLLLPSERKLWKGNVTNK